MIKSFLGQDQVKFLVKHGRKNTLKGRLTWTLMTSLCTHFMDEETEAQEGVSTLSKGPWGMAESVLESTLGWPGSSPYYTLQPKLPSFYVTEEFQISSVETGSLLPTTVFMLSYHTCSLCRQDIILYFPHRGLALLIRSHTPRGHIGSFWILLSAWSLL